MSGRERKRFLWILFLIGLTILALAVISDATTLARVKCDDLTSQASAVGRMRCLRTESHWQNGEIWTHTEFAVLELNKGPLSRFIQVEMPGGVIGHLHARVEAVPMFSPGEEAYLFLWTAPNGAYQILGWTQGGVSHSKRSRDWDRISHAGFRRGSVIRSRYLAVSSRRDS